MSPRRAAMLGALVVLALAAAPLGLALAADGDAARFVEAVLAEIDTDIVTASDIALARALGTLGFSSGSAPIEFGDVDRMIRARLALAEAQRLGIEVSGEELERAWEEASRKLGGRDALDGWLEETGVDRSWARTIVRQDLRMQRFVELRFRSFAFVSEEELDEAGAGRNPAERQEVRERLRAEKADRELTAWLDSEARRAGIRRVLGPGERVPCPLAMPRPR